VTRWPRYCSPGWLAAYAVSGGLWIAIFEVTPIPLIIAFTSAGALGIVVLGNLIDCGHPFPPEERR
jgi:hypothetical protein